MKSKLLLFLGAVGTITLGFIPQLALAGGEPAEFSWLVGIPGVSGGAGTGFNQYINALYALAISLAALIAVVKIVIAGAKYMMDDIVTHKSEAKQDIKNALIGLLIVIGAVIILNTINTDLTNVQVDATPATVNDDPLEFVDRTANLCAEAITRNSSCGTFECIISDVYNETSCAEDCRAIGGIYSSGWTYDQCSYSLDSAAACDPQESFACCERIKNGDWDSDATTNQCSGMDSPTELREACYTRRSNWDEAAGTCRTNACDRNTNAACCSLGYNGTLANGVCNTTQGPPVLPPVNTGTLNSALAGIPPAMVDSIRTRVQDNIGGANYISSATDINAIVTENGAEGVYVAARIPNGIGEETRIALIRNTVEGICNDIGGVNSNAGVVEGELSDGTSYIACAR